jgi:flagellar basal body-associated protein FliL
MTIRQIIDFYVDGFKAMTLGRKLWLLIIIKLIIFFAVIKVIFFPDLLKSRYDTDTERADAVRTSLVGTTK